MPMKNSNETVGNRSRDLSACSVVPKPTAPRRIRCCRSVNKMWNLVLINCIKLSSYFTVGYRLRKTQQLFYSRLQIAQSSAVILQ